MALFRPVPILVSLFVMGSASTAAAQESASQPWPKHPTPEPTWQDCSDCHNGRELDPTTVCVSWKLLAQSVHSGLECSSCHPSITVADVNPSAERPHGMVGAVDCGECHEEAAEAYVKHGRMEVGKDADIPACWSCHGTHDILAPSDLHSYVHPSNLAQTCMSCHTDVDLVRQHDVLAEGPIRLYESSVHGRSSKKGLYKQANCNNCHSSPGPDGTPSAHRILGAADPESTIYHFNIPDTCAQCHKPIAADYWDGVHGRLVKRGDLDSPVCTTCHGEHGIISPSDPASPVSAAQVAEQTCSPCHESVVLNERYGVPGGRLKSYVDSYHGHKGKGGDVKVANCASCHGAHRILPSTDPTSSIHAGNLQATCGECHPGISPELASTGIHTTPTEREAGWPEFFRDIYIILIAVTIGGMLLHNGAHWVRHVKLLAHKPFIMRLTANETAQHWALMISFIILVASGFSLRFSESWWVQALFGWGEEGRGFVLRGKIHRGAAVVMILVSLWHVFYLFSRRGRHMLGEMMPRWCDLTHIKENILFFLGIRGQEPRFGRFSYVEKLEYWALAWGTVIMTGTGILLVFDNYFITRWNLPKGFLDVMLVIHYYEAWLASLAILVWHVYGTVFSPTVYPMNPAWLAGRMPKAMYDHEHPDGPRLKVRTFRSFYEEEVDDDSAERHPPVPRQ